MKSIDVLLQENPGQELRVHWDENLGTFTVSMWEEDELLAAGHSDTFGGALVRIHKLMNE